MQDIGVIKLAGAMASYASQRHALLTENIANADTPGFRAQDLPDFNTVYNPGPGPGSLRATRNGHFGPMPGQAVYAPQEIAAFGAEQPNGNSVTLEDQMVRSAENQHQHELAMAIYAKTISILRLGLGKRG